MITGLVGVTLWTDDIERMFRFYHDILQLPLHSHHDDFVAFQLGHHLLTYGRIGYIEPSIPRIDGQISTVFRIRATGKDQASIASGVLMNQQEITARLREREVRVTPQRLAIAEAVINSTDHPSVQQIFERVRDHFPSMTLATIYSTLDVLERSGLIH